MLVQINKWIEEDIQNRSPDMLKVSITIIPKLFQLEVHRYQWPRVQIQSIAAVGISSILVFKERNQGRSSAFMSLN